MVEKHGPHLPMGTDMLDAREVALRAAKKEYSIVFLPYYFSQIFEAKHQPGTLAYSARLIWDVLQETVDEIARNGIKKIVVERFIAHRRAERPAGEAKPRRQLQRHSHTLAAIKVTAWWAHAFFAAWRERILAQREGVRPAIG